MVKIIILYTDAGGGHRTTAFALKKIIQENTDWQVQLLNPYKDLCLEFDLLYRFTKHSSEEVYNRIVSSSTFSLLNLLIIAVFFKINLFVYRKKIIEKFRTKWSIEHANIVLSVTPFINNYVYESTTNFHPTLPFVTVITDYSECIKDIWIVSKNQNVICASSKIVEQSLAKGIDASKIFKLSGMIVPPKFYTVKNIDKQLLCDKFSLNSKMATGIIMFGSYGDNDMLTIAKSMINCDFPLQLIFICGYNSQLILKLQKIKVDYKLLVLGFVDNVEEYMHCADFFIGKPGGLSISEAAVSCLPMIIKYNMFTLLQERYNAHWVSVNGLGLTVKNFDHILEDIKKILENYSYYINNLHKLNNQSVFEVSKILSQLLLSSTSVTPTLGSK